MNDTPEPSSRRGSLRPMRPVPRRSRRPWAGRRLGDQVGELWVADPAALVEVDGLGSISLDALAAIEGEGFIGTAAMRRLGPRFPLLVKLIDAADWLSIQVHPSDELASEMYGAGQLGKTEAWIVLGADPEARLVIGPRPGLSDQQLRDTIRAGRMGREDCDDQPARPGETLLIPTGTIHAIGAGVFIYEIEEPSDLTFRMSDWGRPSTPDRPLHLEESLRAVRPDNRALLRGTGWRLDGGMLEVPDFRLEIAEVPEATPRRPGGSSLHVLTSIRGRSEVAGDGWTETLEPFMTLVVPASDPGYLIGGPPGGLVCVGSIP